MKVHKSYYLDGKFDRPDKVTHVVRWANALMDEEKEGPKFKLAKRIKSLCLKHYKINRDSPVRFCRVWEEQPQRFMHFVLDEFPDGECRILRKIKSGPFSPDNVVLAPKV